MIFFLAIIIIQSFILINAHIQIQQMNFISQRQSQAQSFATQTQNNSFLSSRRRLFDEAEHDLQQFKQQINFKFIRSISNKTYTYPLSEEAYDILNDEQQFQDLINAGEYNIHEQKIANAFKKEQFKLTNRKLYSKNAHELLTMLKNQKQRLGSLKSYLNENLNSNKHHSRDSHNSNTKRSVKNGNQAQYLYDIIYEEPQQLMRKKRLLTQPYDKNDKNDKSSGFIMKRK